MTDDHHPNPSVGAQANKQGGLQGTSPENSESRFEFGKNWQAFLNHVDDDRILKAEESLANWLETDSLADQTFLDLGSGSGLFSLAAHRMAATVTSVDLDPQCVACTKALKQRFGKELHSPGTGSWEVLQGSILDPAFVSHLPMADVVYSWGVLHHTGEMEFAIDQASSKVKPGGKLFIAIYNDQGGGSSRWLLLKKMYHRLPKFLRPAYVCLIAGIYELKFSLARLLAGRNPLPFSDWAEKKRDRGMSVWHDWVDWIGGLPFECATPEKIIEPLVQKGFSLRKLKTVRGWGCNEYVFCFNPGAPDGVE